MSSAQSESPARSESRSSRSSSPTTSSSVTGTSADFPLRTLGDAPVDDDVGDRLGFAAIADGLARLIEGDQTGTPLTIALSAPWGAGKTSLLNLVHRRLVQQRVRRKQAPYIVVWFNAWMHDAAPNLSAALAADVARHATRYRDPWTRLWHPLPTVMLSPKEKARRTFWISFLAVAVAIGLYPLVSAIVGPSASNVTRVRAAFGASAVGWFALLWTLSAILPRANRGVAAVAAFVDSPRSAAATGSMMEVKEQLGNLIAEARAGCRRAWRSEELPRFVVIVDDLERCQPPKAVDMCEVASQLLAHEGVITVLVGDLRVIAVSAELKYHDAAVKFQSDPGAASEGWSDYGRFFLEKVVQFELELPPIAASRLRALATSAPISASTSTKIDDPTTVRTAYRGLLLSPITALVVSSVAIEIALVATLGVGSKNDGATLALGVPLLMLLAGVLGLWLLARYRKLVAESRRYVDQIVDEQVARESTARTVPPTVAQIRDAVAAIITSNDRTSVRRYAVMPADEEITRRIQSYVAQNSAIRRSAEEAIVNLLPALPRTAKRLLNRLSFLLVVASSRQLLNGPDGVSAQQIAKWAVLSDRWPEVGRAVARDPALLQRLESAAPNAARFQRLCREQQPPLIDQIGRRRELLTANPPIADAAWTLVYMDSLAELPADLRAYV